MVAALHPTSLPDVIERTRPLMLARDQTLPVLPALEGLLPDGGLQRGSTVVVEGGPGATSLGLALGAAPSAAGGWVAVVGAPDVGLVAAVELGIAPERLVLVADPPPERWAEVVAALIGAVDVVLVGGGRPVRAADARRLAARARERGTVLVQLGPGARRGPGLEVDLRLTVTATAWTGLGAGHGHLETRRVTVEATGRRRAARPRRIELWLPDHEGRVAPVVGSSPAVGSSPVVAAAFAGADIDRLVDGDGGGDDLELPGAS